MNIELLAEQIREMSDTEYNDTAACIEILIDNLIRCGFLYQNIKEDLISQWKEYNRSNLEDFFK